jgi:hypothetical protein
VMDILAAARQHVESQLGQLDLPFKLPTVERLACLVPGTPEPTGSAAPPSPDEGARMTEKQAPFTSTGCEADELLGYPPLTFFLITFFLIATAFCFSAASTAARSNRSVFK